jgi:hypothetical protein
VLDRYRPALWRECQGIVTQERRCCDSSNGTTYSSASATSARVRPYRVRSMSARRDVLLARSAALAGAWYGTGAAGSAAAGSAAVCCCPVVAS